MAKVQQAPKAAPEEVSAKAAAAEGSQSEQVKVRVLRDCQFGACNAVAVIDKALAETLEGVVDMSPESVAYAESLT